MVYKSADDCRLILEQPKLLQGKVNKIMRKTVKFSSNPFADDDAFSQEGSDAEDSDKDPEQEEHKRQMEEGGFIMVAPETQGSKKGRGTDGVNTVQGIS